MTNIFLNPKENQKATSTIVTFLSQEDFLLNLAEKDKAPMYTGR